MKASAIRHGLFFKFAVMITAACFLILLPAGFWLTELQATKLLNEHDSSSRALTAIVARISASHIANNNYILLENNSKLLQTETQSDLRILSVRIYDTQGTKLNLSGTAPEDIGVNPEYWLTVEQDCVHVSPLGAESVVGKVTMIFSQEPVIADIRSMRLTYFLLIPLVVVALNAIIIAMLSRMVIKPLHGLSDMSRKLSEGRFDIEVPSGAADEIGQLAEAFNNMAKELKKSFYTIEVQNKALQIARDELEERVQERTQDLARKARELEVANRRLVELDSMKSAFLSSVSHELRTPLTSVLGFAKVITKDFSRHFATEEAFKHPNISSRILNNLEIISQEGERLTRLINDVLDLTRIESGRQRWNDHPVDTAECIDNAVQALTPAVDKKPGVKLVVNYPPGLPLLHMDPDKLQQVLINLLDNAIKFTEQGEVVITAEADIRMVRISVRDTGLGIEAGDLARIFDSFHQVGGQDTLQETRQGSGLGLAISRQIVEHYQGRIHVESTPGQGSAFHVELPLERRPKAMISLDSSQGFEGLN